MKINNEDKEFIKKIVRSTIKYTKKFMAENIKPNISRIDPNPLKFTEPTDLDPNAATFDTDVFRELASRASPCRFIDEDGIERDHWKKDKKQKKTKLTKAIKTLCKALVKSKNYYYSWQANIAMAFYDEITKTSKFFDHDQTHRIANQAAKNFLNNLTKNIRKSTNENSNNLEQTIITRSKNE